MSIAQKSHIESSRFPWRGVARCERLIGRLDERLKDDTLFARWISIESRIEAIHQMALLGDLIHADHLCDYEIGLRAFARMDTRAFPEALGTRRAVVSIARQTFPRSPSAGRLQDLFYRALAPARDVKRIHATGRKKKAKQELSDQALEDVYGSEPDWLQVADHESLELADREREGWPPLTVFEEIVEAWDSLPADDGLLSVARGVRGVFRMSDRFVSREGERGFTHLALLAVPILVRRFCQTKRSFGFVASSVSRNSEKFRSALYGSDEQWAETFLEAVSDGLEANLGRVQRIEGLLAQLEGRTDGKGKSGNIASLVDLFFEQPVLVSGEVAKRLGVSVRLANVALQELKRQKFISVRGNRARYRVWEAFRIIDMIHYA